MVKKSVIWKLYQISPMNQNLILMKNYKIYISIISKFYSSSKNDFIVIIYKQYYTNRDFTLTHQN